MSALLKKLGRAPHALLIAGSCLIACARASAPPLEEPRADPTPPPRPFPDTFEPRRRPARGEVPQLLGAIEPQVKDCASRTPKHPEPAITFRFTFEGKTGGVGQYEIIDGSAELRRCLDPLIRQLRFEPFEEAVFKVTYPYRY